MSYRPVTLPKGYQLVQDSTLTCNLSFKVTELADNADPDTLPWRSPTLSECTHTVGQLNGGPFYLCVAEPEFKCVFTSAEPKEPKVPRAKVVRPRRPAAPVLLPSYAIKELTDTEPMLYGDRITRINPADNIPDQGIFSDWIGSLASRAKGLGWKVVRHIPIPATPFTKTDSGMVVQFEPSDPPVALKGKALNLVAQYLKDLNNQLSCLSESNFIRIKAVTLRLIHHPVGAGTKLVNLPNSALLLGPKDEIRIGDKRLLVSDNTRSSEEDVPFSWIGLRAEQISVSWEIHRYT